jgi:hypothetical protein
MPSLVHEGLGHRAIEPDRIQGDAVLLPHACITAQSWDHVMAAHRAIVPTIQPRTALATVKAWPGNSVAWRFCTTTASLDRGCARRIYSTTVGTKKRLSQTKKLIKELAAMP